MGDQADSCVFCDEPLNRDDPTKAIHTIHYKAVATVRAMSIRRRDKKFLKLKHLEEVDTHVACYEAYVEEGRQMLEKSREARKQVLARCIEKKKQAEARAKAEAASMLQAYGFNFSGKCFLCGTDASDAYIKKLYGWPARKRRTVQIIARESTKDRILEQARRDSDKSENKVIIERIENVDLVGIKARYHKKCLEKFYLTKAKTSLKGRPVREMLVKAINFIVDYVASTPNDERYSLKTLLQKYPGPEKPMMSVVRKRIDQFVGNTFVLESVLATRDCELVRIGSREQFVANWHRHLQIIKRE